MDAAPSPAHAELTRFLSPPFASPIRPSPAPRPALHPHLLEQLEAMLPLPVSPAPAASQCSAPQRKPANREHPAVVPRRISLILRLASATRSSPRRERHSAAPPAQRSSLSATAPTAAHPKRHSFTTLPPTACRNELTRAVAAYITVVVPRLKHRNAVYSKPQRDVARPPSASHGHTHPRSRQAWATRLMAITYAASRVKSFRLRASSLTAWKAAVILVSRRARTSSFSQ